MSEQDGLGEPAAHARGGGIWFWASMALLSAGLMVYAQTLCFTGDEGYHLLAAALIKSGMRPYLDFCFEQTPLNAYWNAFWMSVFGESWRTAHAMASLETSAAVCLAADFIYRRFPAGPWRLGVAIATAVAMGANSVVVEFGPLGQAYGICLLLTVAAFRVTVAAVEGRAWLAPLAGALAGASAASSLLTAPVAPVLCLWLLWNQRTGNRWWRGAAFAAGALVPFIPVARLAVRAPWVVWFNLAEYHFYFRQIYWPNPLRHDVEELTAWTIDPQAVLLGLLAICGLVWVAKRSGFDRATRREFYLCGLLSPAIALELAFGHPTFLRYFVFLTPFVGILAACGLYAIGSRVLSPERPFWPVLALSLITLCALARDLYDRRTLYNWPQYEAITRKVLSVTPHGAPIFADNLVYFLTKRRPLPGMENDYSHQVNLPPAKMARLHILPEKDMKQKLADGVFVSATGCDDDDVDDYKLNDLYNKKAVVFECTVFWDFKKKP